MALEISLCWFVSILLMTLLMLVVALLQKLESNNDTLSLSLLFGAHLTNTDTIKTRAMTVTMRRLGKDRLHRGG